MDILTIIIGATLTYYLHNKSKLCATKSSALLTVIAYAASQIITFNLSLFFGGTFIGMSSNQKINIWQIFVACLGYKYVLDLTIAKLLSLGGGLGFSAFVLIFFTFSAAVVFRQSRDPRT